MASITPSPGENYFLKNSPVKFTQSGAEYQVDIKAKNNEEAAKKVASTIKDLVKRFPGLEDCFKSHPIADNIYKITVPRQALKEGALPPPAEWVKQRPALVRETMDFATGHSAQVRIAKEIETKAAAQAEAETKKVAEAAESAPVSKAESHLQALNGIIFVHTGRLQRLLALCPGNGVPPKSGSPIEVVGIEGDKEPFVVTIRGPQGEFSYDMSDAQLNQMRIDGGYEKTDLESFKKIQQVLIEKLNPKAIRQFIESRGEEAIIPENYKSDHNYKVAHLTMIPSGVGTVRPNFLLILRPLSGPVVDINPYGPFEDDPAQDISPRVQPASPGPVMDINPFTPASPKPVVVDINPYVVPGREGSISRVDLISDKPFKQDVVIVLSRQELEGLTRFI